MRDSLKLIEYPYFEKKSSNSLLPSPKIMHKRLAVSSSLNKRTSIETKKANVTTNNFYSNDNRTIKSFLS